MLISREDGSSNKACQHSCMEHLFRSIRCSRASLLQRIAVLIFHILTLCIPLALYFLIAYCCPSKRPSEITPSKPSPLPDKKTFPHPPVAQLHDDDVPGPQEEPPVVVGVGVHEDGNVSSADEDGEEDQIFPPDQHQHGDIPGHPQQQQPSQNVGIAGPPEEPPVVGVGGHEDGNVSSADEDEEDDQVLPPDQHQHGDIPGHPEDPPIVAPGAGYEDFSIDDGLRSEQALLRAREALNAVLNPYLEESATHVIKAIAVPESKAAQDYRFCIDKNDPLAGQPDNNEVRHMAYMHEKLYRDWQDAICDHERGEYCWNDPELIAKTTQLMDVAYSLVQLMLDDLEKKVNKTSGGHSLDICKEELLISDDYYYRRVFFKLATVYHYARCCYKWDSLTEKLVWSEIPSLEFSISFYDDSTPQNGWRCLYNAICSRVTLLLDQNKLCGLGKLNYLAWYAKDLTCREYKYPKGLKS